MIFYITITLLNIWQDGFLKTSWRVRCCLLKTLIIKLSEKNLRKGKIVQKYIFRLVYSLDNECVSLKS